MERAKDKTKGAWDSKAQQLTLADAIQRLKVFDGKLESIGNNTESFRIHCFRCSTNVSCWKWELLSPTVIHRAKVLTSIMQVFFSCGRGMFVWGKLHWGNQIWVAKQVAATPSPQTELPRQNNCKHGEAAAHGSVFLGEKAEKLDINPSVRSQEVPERLVCVRWIIVLQRSRPEKS